MASFEYFFSTPIAYRISLIFRSGARPVASSTQSVYTASCFSVLTGRASHFCSSTFFTYCWVIEDPPCTPR